LYAGKGGDGGNGGVVAGGTGGNGGAGGDARGGGILVAESGIVVIPLPVEQPDTNPDNIVPPIFIDLLDVVNNSTVNNNLAAGGAFGGGIFDGSLITVVVVLPTIQPADAATVNPDVPNNFSTGLGAGVDLFESEVNGNQACGGNGGAGASGTTGGNGGRGGDAQ